MFDDFEVVN